MAEAVLFGLARELLKKLGSRVIQEIGIWFGFKEELSKLKNIVSVIQTVLLDAEEQHGHNNQVREWLGKLKEVVFDADDLLDEFSTESLNRELLSENKITKEVRAFFSSSNQVVYDIKMGNKVKSIRERLDEIVAERKFHLETRLAEKPFMSVGRDQTHSFVRDEDVIGREEDKKSVRELLLNRDVKDNVLIIPIVGIGGLGKTTLAQNVYNDDSVKSCFEVRMWVCVSEPFEVKVIVEKMIRSASGKKVGNLDMDQLQSVLRMNIDRKKYLLVLDDVWNENRNQWLDLEGLLTGGAKGSRIIVTTRSKRVAKTISALEPYFLSGLSEEKAWVLFSRLVFKKIEDSYNQVVVDIGKRVVKKCVGVPLAIKTIGGLLYSKDPKTEWLSFESKEFSNIAQKENDILPTLKLSYDHLPSHLKNCFAYCKLFPKDYDISIRDLIRLWMAQGFIESFDKEIFLFDIGLEYFNDLLWRSFFQEVKTNESGNIVSCKMHDLMHDLAILVGGTESVLLKPTQMYYNEKTRHVSFQSPMEISSSMVIKGLNVRSLLADECSFVDRKLVFSSLTCLRILKLERASLEKIPKSIGKLRHLRYLDLSWNNFKTLPSSVTKLQNLQTFILERCFYLETLPVDLNKLRRLVYLNVKYCSSLKEMPRGDFPCLETFYGFCINKGNSFGLNGLCGLNKLRGNFRIVGLEYNMKNDAADCLKGKQHLQSLELKWGLGWYYRLYGGFSIIERSLPEVVGESDRDEMTLKNLQPHLNLKMLTVDDYRGRMFATWLSSLANLVTLELIKCTNIGTLSRLDHLTCLRTLKIHSASFLEFIEEEHDVNWSNESGGGEPLSVFPSLENLSLSNCFFLEGWWKRTQHPHCYFSRLSTLSIKSCPNLKALPSFPCLEGRLSLSKLSGKPLLQTMSCFRENHVPLSRITDLELEEVHDIASLPEECFRGSNCLKSLTFRSCERLSSLKGMFQHLTSLKRLCIARCRNLDFSIDMQWKGLKSLSELGLIGLPKLISLPGDISTFTSLQKLRICDCTNLDFSVDMQWNGLRSLSTLNLGHLPQLTSLPDGIFTLTSLKKLEISNCSNLISLPDEISTLTSLKELRIVECPNLWKRCQKETGEEWHKIAHIPLITEFLFVT